MSFMSAWLRDDLLSPTGEDHRRGGPFAAPGPEGDHRTGRVTARGAEWLASAGTYPRSLLALWETRPTAPAALPCGSVFDIVNAPAVFGRRLLDRLWEEGPGSGPVAVHRGRVLVFAAPGTARRLPALLGWEEWGASVPPLLCHGTGDAVTVPALSPAAARTGDGTGPAGAGDPRWLVAPDTRHPWLPGPEVLLWACVRTARTAPEPGVRVSIFPPADQGAKVYDVSRRR
jgi:hypothetical protein